MGARDLLSSLAGAGLSVTAEAGRLVIRPASKLTDDMREALRVAKPELLALLADVDQPAVDPDRWCWPASAAMNGAELQNFTGRVLLFTRRGFGNLQAEALADRLVMRDREQDDRRTCLECITYRPGRCGNSRNAGLTTHQISDDLAALLQRCPGFLPVPNSGIQPATPRSNAQLLKA